MPQAAYSPALGAVILFGGYNGQGGNFAYNDTWEFVGNTWTELFPGVSPPARFGGVMVYEAEAQALILFGGRNDTGFFNDTWEYNASGWHNISSPHSPSARAWFGMSYDPALGEIALFGGGIGNVPAGHVLFLGVLQRHLDVGQRGLDEHHRDRRNGTDRGPASERHDV